MAKKRYLTYEPRQRKILKEDRWIAVLRQEEMCSLDEIATEIAFRTTAGKSEVEGLLLAFLEQIKYHLVYVYHDKIKSIKQYQYEYDKEGNSTLNRTYMKGILTKEEKDAE